MVLPLRSGAAALLPQQGTAQSDTEKTPQIDAVGAWYRSGTTAEDPPAVLPLRSGTAACDPSAVLPLGSTVLPLGPRQDKEKWRDLFNGMEKLGG